MIFWYTSGIGPTYIYLYMAGPAIPLGPIQPPRPKYGAMAPLIASWVGEIVFFIG